MLSQLLDAAAANVEAQMQAARREADAGHAEAAAARRQLAQQADEFRGLLKQALARAEDQQRQQLRRQAEQLTAAHAGARPRVRGHVCFLQAPAGLQCTPSCCAHLYTLLPFPIPLPCRDDGA